MITIAVIKSFLDVAILALTPVQRWDAAGKFYSDFMAQRWFILIGIIAIVTLTVLFFVVSFKRTRQERKASNRLFAKYAEKRGLTANEREILLSIANNAGLKRNESIFTLASAFDRGAAKMKENFVNQQTSEEAGRLRTELSFLSEKLGFINRYFYSKGIANKSKKLSSRQIPAGKTVHMTRLKAQDSGDVEAAIVRNSDTELAVRLAKPVKITFGEFWCIRYYFGSSVWEFETSVVSCDGNILVLNHGEDVRFVNRRRFLRVSVRKPAFIARFSFVKSFDLLWGPPKFVPAVVTELAGPGLRIESRLEVKEGERILVVFSPDEEQGGDLTTADAGILKIIEDIGEVKHTRTIPDGLSIAVELTGLSDSDVDEMIRITNAALVKANVENKNISASTKKEENMVYMVEAQGV
ncbi:MAG: PilZ domain-containing protein [Planctomycetota bacterium]|jgi:hypothetical protein